MGRMKDLMIKMQETGQTLEECYFEEQLKFVYSNSGLGLRDFMNQCKIILEYNKDGKFKSLSPEQKKNYIHDKEKSSFVRGDLINTLCSEKNKKETKTLFEIYTTISDFFDKYEMNKENLKLFKEKLKDSDNILLVSVEMYAKNLPELLKDENGSITTKNITIWVFDEMLDFILENDYKDYENIKVESKDLYYCDDETKFSTILCIPEFMNQRGKMMTEYTDCSDLGIYGLNKLFNHNLAEDGKIFIVLSNKVNYSDKEETFRNKYQKHLVSVQNLSNNTFGFSRIKIYLYEFRKANYNGPVILSGFEKNINIPIGKKWDEILNNEILNNEKWDFENTFQEDEDIKCLKKSKYNNLEDLAEIKRGNAISAKAKETNNKEDFIFINLPQLTQDNIKYENAPKYKSEADLSRQYIKYNDILIANRGNSQNIAIHKRKNCNCIVSQYITIIRPKENIEPEFLAIYLKSNIGQKLLKSIQHNNTVPVIEHENLGEIPVPDFDKKERMEIVENYTKQINEYTKQRDEIDKKIDKLNNDLNDKLCKRKSAKLRK